jgi:hypothetical protein
MPSTQVAETVEVQATQIVAAPQATAPPAEQASEAATEAPVEAKPEEPRTPVPEAKPPPSASPTPPELQPTPIPPEFLPTPGIEERLVELEYPERIRLGDSDVIRLSLIPSEEGYKVVTEFEDHTTETLPVEILRPPGYDLFAAARIDGVGFNIAPGYEEELYLPPGEPITWRWSIKPLNAGKHRLSLLIKLRWKPADNSTRNVHESVVYSRGLDVLVTSFLGLSQAQAMSTGWVSLMFAGGAFLAALVARPRLGKTARPAFTSPKPNQELRIELPHQMVISPNERRILQGLFQNYGRIVIEKEFLSGYSGARTFLTLPVRADGRSDAYTIAKIGEKSSIQAEYQNYEAFVRDTLPPITARIQSPPVIDPKGSRVETSNSARSTPQLAALRYTFIGEPGSMPVSLGNALRQQPDPGLITKLFDTFGPNWWMQRRPYVFRLAQEYDRLLPPHLVVEPSKERSQVLDGRTVPIRMKLKTGDVITFHHFKVIERRLDGESLSLISEPSPSHPPLRVRWLSLVNPENASGRVIDTRRTLLDKFTIGFDLFGLPNPFSRLPDILEETVSGTQSTIHGDLNLENVLLGPGNLVWLIDFAQTRDGHTLFDFAHLETELIAHLFADRLRKPEVFADMLPSIFNIREQVNRIPPGDPEIAKLILLTDTLHQVVVKCLFNPSQPREYYLALYMACMGALKFANLDAHAKHLVYLTGAYLSQKL